MTDRQPADLTERRRAFALGWTAGVAVAASFAFMLLNYFYSLLRRAAELGSTCNVSLVLPWSRATARRPRHDDAVVKSRKHREARDQINQHLPRDLQHSARERPPRPAP